MRGVMNKFYPVSFLLLLFFTGCGEAPIRDREIFFEFPLEGGEFNVVEYSIIFSGFWSGTTGQKKISINQDFTEINVELLNYRDKNSNLCSGNYLLEVSNLTTEQSDLTLADPYPRPSDDEDENIGLFKNTKIRSGTLNLSPPECDLNPQEEAIWHLELYQKGDVILTDYGRDVEYLLYPSGR